MGYPRSAEAVARGTAGDAGVGTAASRHSSSHLESSAPVHAGDVGSDRSGDMSADSQQIERVRHLDSHVEKTFKDGRREVEFANGLRKLIYPDGRTTVMFQNGDQKEIQPDGVVVYRYIATGAVQTTLQDGTELYQFPDGQVERHNKDGSKEIRFPNGTAKQIFQDGSEEVRFSDGSRRTTPASQRSETK